MSYVRLQEWDHMFREVLEGFPGKERNKENEDVVG